MLAVVTAYVKVAIFFAVAVKTTIVKTVLARHVINVMVIFARNAKQLALNATKSSVMIVRKTLVNTAEFQYVVRARVNIIVY